MPTAHSRQTRNLQTAGNSRVTIPQIKPYVLRHSRTNIATPSGDVSSKKKNSHCPFHTPNSSQWFTCPHSPPPTVAKLAVFVGRRILAICDSTEFHLAIC